MHPLLLDFQLVVVPDVGCNLGLPNVGCSLDVPEPVPHAAGLAHAHLV